MSFLGARTTAAIAILLAALHMTGALLFSAIPLGIARAQTGTVQMNIVNAARAAYANADFREAIALLETALQEGTIAEPDRISALEVLARSYFKTGETIKSEEAWRSLLDADPAWRPGPDVPPDEAGVFSRVLDQSDRGGESSEIHREKNGWPTWKWLAIVGAGGLAVAGTLVAVMGSGGSDEPETEEIGDPPPPPNRAGR